MAQQLRALNEEGRQAYRRWLEELSLNPSLPVPNLLSDPEYSYAPIGDVSLPPSPFASKLELAAALLPTVEQIERKRITESRWPGIWDGLALAYFDDICPPKAGGDRAIRAIERYCYTDDYLKRHRHRVAGPVLFRRLSPDGSRLFLDGAPDKLSDEEEQIGSRQELGGNSMILDALGVLYWDSTASRPKKGWAPNSHKPGTLRRFVAVTNQLSRTFDLSGCTVDGLRSLLPREFDRWHKSPATAAPPEHL